MPKRKNDHYLHPRVVKLPAAPTPARVKLPTTPPARRHKIRPHRRRIRHRRGPNTSPPPRPSLPLYTPLYLSTSAPNSPTCALAAAESATVDSPPIGTAVFRRHMMSPRRHPRSSTVFHNVRHRGSGRYLAEIMQDGMQYWLDTYDGLEVAARTFDKAWWHLGWPKRDLNFPMIETQDDAEFVGSEIEMTTVTERQDTRIVLDRTFVIGMRLPWRGLRRKIHTLCRRITSSGRRGTRQRRRR